MRLFDTAVACTIGLNLPEAKELRALLHPDSDLQSLITALVGATRATEVDDIAISGCVTAGSVVVPVALACAAKAGLPLPRALDAIVDGYEAMITTAEAIDGAHIVYKGIWPTLAAAPAGAVVTAGRLMGKDSKAIRDALILTTTRTIPRPDRTQSRWWLLGRAAADAVATCRLSSLPPGDPASVTAWAAAQGFAYAPPSLTPDLPRISHVDVKPFPTARQGLAAITAFQRLATRVPLKDNDRILVKVPSIYAPMIGGTALPSHRIGTLLQVSYQIALAALTPDRLYDVARETFPTGPDIEQFLSRVTVEADPDLDRLYPRSWAGSVRFESDETEIVRDLSPLGWPELAVKATHLAKANTAIPRSRFNELEELIRSDASPASILNLLVEG